MKTWGKMFARGRRLRLSAGRGCIRKPVAARGFVSGRGPKTDRTAGRNLFLDSRRAGFGRDEVSVANETFQGRVDAAAFRTDIKKKATNKLLLVALLFIAKRS